METKSKFCDSCGSEIIGKSAQVTSRIGNIKAIVKIELWKPSGAWADICHNCAKTVLDNAEVTCGDQGVNKLAVEIPKTWLLEN